MIPDLFRLYGQLSKLKQSIARALPKVQGLITQLNRQQATGMLTRNNPDYIHALESRKTLLDSFARFDALAKKIGALETENTTERRIQLKLQISANTFLQDNMLTLAAMPRLAPARPASMVSSMSASITPNGNAIAQGLNGSSAHIRRGTVSALTAGLAGESDTTVKSSMVTQDVTASRLRDELHMLRDQRGRVQVYLERLGPDREDEKIILRSNLYDLEKAIEDKRDELQAVI